MIKIIGVRQSGKTTQLLKHAHENGYVLIVPNFRALTCTVELARELGYHDVEIITAIMFIKNGRYDYNKKYLIDDLDWFLEQINVVGYSREEDDITDFSFEQLMLSKISENKIELDDNSKKEDGVQ